MEIACWLAYRLTCLVSSSRSWTQPPVWSIIWELATTSLSSLHWLRAPERILYKMSVLTYKALHVGSPRYISSLVHVANVSGRPALRSAGSNRLRISPFKLSTIGGLAFPVAAAQIWNRLPRPISGPNSGIAT